MKQTCQRFRCTGKRGARESGTLWYALRTRPGARYIRWLRCSRSGEAGRCTASRPSALPCVYQCRQRRDPGFPSCTRGLRGSCSLLYRLVGHGNCESSRPARPLAVRAPHPSPDPQHSRCVPKPASKGPYMSSPTGSVTPVRTSVPATVVLATVPRREAGQGRVVQVVVPPGLCPVPVPPVPPPGWGGCWQLCAHFSEYPEAHFGGYGCECESVSWVGVGSSSRAGRARGGVQ